MVPLLRLPGCPWGQRGPAAGARTVGGNGRADAGIEQRLGCWIDSSLADSRTTEPDKGVIALEDLVAAQGCLTSDWQLVATVRGQTDPP